MIFVICRSRIWSAPSVSSPISVDTILEEALAGGARTQKPVLEYAFPFVCPFLQSGGHVWEFIWMAPPGERFYVLTNCH